jgi:hypothetical protein
MEFAYLEFEKNIWRSEGLRLGLPGEKSLGLIYQ